MYSSMAAEDHHDGVSSSNSLQPNPSSSSSSSSASLLYSFSVLKEKVHQIQSLVTILLYPDHQTHQNHPESAASVAIASMSNVIQELIATASSMMFASQQMALEASTSSEDQVLLQHHHNQQQQQLLKQGVNYSCGETLEWFGGGNYTTSTSTTPPPPPPTCDIMKANNKSCNIATRVEAGKAINPNPNHHQLVGGESTTENKQKNYDVIELNAADLLAKYTHYCQVCGKGFKRDANLRMHMRAHGDEYKTPAALSNPMKSSTTRGNINAANNNNNSVEEDEEEEEDFGAMKLPRKYSCPQEGCRWNQRHAKFQPLKSMICVKNHYKRSHCPKMYVCKRCNRKQFSVLSDLRTHEKHCGDLKWQCSCGTTFSRKDKLMGHVALFVGHSPIINTSLTKLPPGKVDNQYPSQIHSIT